VRLADRLIERYNLRGKSVLEIGCGSGEFLEIVSDRGGNTGVGIDPAAPIAPSGRQPLHYIRDTFDERYVDLDVEFVCCRNTLDCVESVSEFTALARRTFGREPVAFFEVADVRRSLRDLSFWAFTCEKPSHFSAGSLSRLFRRNNFDVFDLRRDSLQESLLIEAVASSGGHEPAWEIEDDLEELGELVRYFQDHAASRIGEWRHHLERIRRRGDRAVLWSSGPRAAAFLAAVGLEDAIAAVVDPSPSRQGRFLPVSGVEVVSPATLLSLRPAVVIATDASDVGEIDEELGRLRLEAALTAL
jgi:hypothetical protein